MTRDEPWENCQHRVPEEMLRTGYLIPYFEFVDNDKKRQLSERHCHLIQYIEILVMAGEGIKGDYEESVTPTFYISILGLCCWISMCDSSLENIDDIFGFQIFHTSSQPPRKQPKESGGITL